MHQTPNIYIFLDDVIMCDLNFLLYIFRVFKVALIRTYIFIVRMRLLAGILYSGHLPNGEGGVKWLASPALTTEAHQTYEMGNI